MKTAYVLVSPCKDEAEYIEKTLQSIEAQTIQPVQWVIVDDGSVDGSMEIVARYRERMPFIRIVHRSAGARQVGPGVIRAFNEGMAHIDVEYDFICKFDVDLDLPPRYFEVMLERMDADPRLGTCSGKPYYFHSGTGQRVSELCGDETSVGMIKFYRRVCFQEIGGFVVCNGWDMYDNHLARWYGWRARSWDDPEIRFIHLRAMGSSQQSIYHGRTRHGDAQFRIGSHPLFVMAGAFYRAVRQPPYVTGAACFLWGYLRAAFSGDREQLGDKEFKRFLRRYQLRALWNGKLGAAEWAFQERARALGRQGLQPPAVEPT
jgi:poly-beta-1,6-N-acetyl-D-glucosamine synthase